MNNEQSSDQLIVRIGKACNFRCNFCNVSDNEAHVKLRETIDDIVRNFHYKLKYSNFQSKYITITISGGEPSIFHKETIFALKYIQRFLDKRGITPYFEIQTNASNIGKDFAQKLKENGIYSALVSFHMIDKEIFEKVIQVPYLNFFKVLEGIKNLHEAGIQVYCNTIMSNENKTNFFETVRFLYYNFPFINIYNIGMIQPHGEALKILDQVYPRYQDVIGEYNKALFFLKRHGKTVMSHFVGPPACYIGSLHESLEVSENILFRQKFNFSEKYLINHINDKNKVQVKGCRKCLYNNVCSGIWKEYVGLQRVKPISYVVDYNGDFKQNNIAYKVQEISENLKRVYDKNIRQVIIPSSIGTQKDIYMLLRKATKLGFYKVSLLIDSDFNISKEVLYTGVSNIQVHRGILNSTMLTLIYAFSQKYKPQFKIDLDLL